MFAPNMSEELFAIHTVDIYDVLSREYNLKLTDIGEDNFKTLIKDVKRFAAKEGKKAIKRAIGMLVVNVCKDCANLPFACKNFPFSKACKSMLNTFPSEAKIQERRNT